MELASIRYLFDHEWDLSGARASQMKQCDLLVGGLYISLHMTTGSKCCRALLRAHCRIGMASWLVAKRFFVAKRGDGGVFFVAEF